MYYTEEEKMFKLLSTLKQLESNGVNEMILDLPNFITYEQLNELCRMFPEASVEILDSAFRYIYKLYPFIDTSIYFDDIFIDDVFEIFELISNSKDIQFISPSVNRLKLLMMDLHNNGYIKVIFPHSYSEVKELVNSAENSSDLYRKLEDVYDEFEKSNPYLELDINLYMMSVEGMKSMFYKIESGEIGK